MMSANGTNHVIIGTRLAARVGLLTDTSLATFFDLLEFRNVGKSFFEGYYKDSTIPLRIEYHDQWEIACNQMKASEFFVAVESIVPDNELQTKTAAFKKLCAQNEGATFDTSIYHAVTNGAVVAKQRISLPAKDKTEFPDYFSQFRNVAKQRAEETETEHEFRLLLNFRLIFRDIKENIK